MCHIIGLYVNSFLAYSNDQNHLFLNLNKTTNLSKFMCFEYTPFDFDFWKIYISNEINTQTGQETKIFNTNSHRSLVCGYVTNMGFYRLNVLDMI